MPCSKQPYTSTLQLASTTHPVSRSSASLARCNSSSNCTRAASPACQQTAKNRHDMTSRKRPIFATERGATELRTFCEFLLMPDMQKRKSSRSGNASRSIVCDRCAPDDDDATSLAEEEAADDLFLSRTGSIKICKDRTENKKTRRSMECRLL